MGQCHGRLKVTCAGAAGRGQGRGTDGAADEKSSAGTAAGTQTQPAGSAAGRWLAGATSGAWMGSQENPAKSRGVARNENGDLLSGGAGGGQRKRTRGTGREGGGQHLGRRGGVGSALKLGGDAGGIGAGQKPGDVRGRSPLDLEFEAEPVEPGGGGAGFL